MLIQIIKWMPPYSDNKALPTPTLNLNFLIISSIFIENKCLSDVIWDLKREGKKRSTKADFALGSIVSKRIRYAL